MTTPAYGFQFNRQPAQVLPAVITDMSSVFIVGVSEDAVGTVLPLLQTVWFNSNDPVLLAGMGNGDIADAIKLLNAQLAASEVAARVAIHRVAKGANDAATIQNILGNQANYTGIYAALAVGGLYGFTTRLLMIAGGFTGKNISRSLATTTVIQQAKAGGNVGNGLCTLAGTPYGANVKPGTYRVQCTGGILAATGAAKAGMVGNGTLGSLTVDGDAPLGVWKVVCGLAAANGGYFSVLRPDGTQDGIAVVGQAYNSAHGPNFTLNDGSTDFAAGDEFDITVVNAVPSNGGVFSVADPAGAVLAPAVVGTAYTSGATVQFTIADGATDFAVGDGFDIIVTQVGGVMNANPIVAALPQICNALAAHAVVDGPNTTPQDALDFRATIANDHIILVDYAVTPDYAATGVYVPGSPCAVGIGVSVDFENGGVPGVSWANRQVYGITALKRYDAFSLNDGSTIGQQLFAAHVGVCERGNSGDAGAVADAGFVQLAAFNCGTDSEWQFFNVTRLRDYIHLQAQYYWRQRLGKSNITVHTIQAVMNDLIGLLRLLKNLEYIIDFRVGLDATKNTPATIEAGGIRVYFKAEEASPLLEITTDSYRYPDALTNLIEQVAGETNALIDTTLSSSANS
jgi:phage tail sheath protein FI